MNTWLATTTVRARLLLAFALLSAAAIACSGEGLRGSKADLDGERTPNAPMVGPCSDEAERECVITLGEQQGTLSCYKGTQACVEGRWSECGDGETYTKRMESREASGAGLSPLARSGPGPCSSNPCDPYCRTYAESPDGGLVTKVAEPSGAPDAGTSGPTVPFDWASGTFNSVPTAKLYELFDEPCTSASDCQANTYCRAPAPGACSHSQCEVGGALSDGCNDCVTDICATTPSCCQDTSCAHDACQTGGPLAAECNACVAAICDSMPSCCSSSWTQACVDAIASTCQPPNTPTAAHCACDNTEVVASDGSCFRLEGTYRDWSNARSTCQAIGSGWDLAAITTASDNSALHGASSRDTWIGASDSATEGDWRWARTGTRFWLGSSSGSPSGGAFTDWASGNPNNYFNNQDCGELSGGDWNDESCSASQPYICQGPPSVMVGGGGPLDGGWTQVCVDAVESVCGAICESGSPTPTDAVCTPWWAGEMSACEDWDLAVGLSCSDAGDDFVTLCNHGHAWAPPEITLAVFSEGSGEFRKASPDMSQAISTCQTAEAVPPGWCINVAGCSGLEDGAEIVANPRDGNELTEECHFDDNWGVHYDSSCGTPLCSGTSTRATVKSINLFFVIDRSGSMLFDSPTRWSSTMAALKSYFSNEASAGINTALRFFPSDNPVYGCNGSACNAAACAVPQVERGVLRAELAPDDAQEGALLGALNSTIPAGGTPMRIAVEGAVSWSAERQARFPNEVHAVVLVTDGEPNDCGNASTVATAAANGRDQGIRTYVIGIEGVSQSTIDSIATSGGGQSFFVSSTQGGVTEQLVSAIQTIAEDVIECDFPLSNPENLDSELASVNYVPRPANTLPPHCLSDQGEFGEHCYYIDPLTASYTGAADNCQTLGPGWGLSSLASQTENDFVRDMASRDVYVGLNRERSPDWAWMSGEPVDFTNWASGEPNGTGPCGLLEDSSGQWMDSSCGSSRDYLCEGPRVGDTTGFCPAGQFSAAEDRCHKVLASASSWANQRSACQALGAGWDLAIIGSQAENDAVAMHLDGSSWLGASDTASEGNWSWIDGSQLTQASGPVSGCIAPAVFNSATGNCYLKGTPARAWTTARSQCEGLGSGWHLVDVNSASEQTFVWNLAGEWAWIGGNDLANEGRYLWSDNTEFSRNGSPRGGNYNNWYPGEPNGNGDCIRMIYDGGWSDWDCADSFPYICEGPTSTTSTATPVGFASFAPGEPNSNTDDCLVIDSNGTWRDGNCGNAGAAVCEGPQEPLPPPPAPPAAASFSQVTSSASCSSDAQWYYDDNTNPTSLSLCPSTCDRIRQDVTARLSVEVGCLPAAAPPPNPYGNSWAQTTYAEVYTADCSGGEEPRWTFAFLEATTPGNSNVTVRLRSADSEAELSGAPWTDVVVLSAANGNQSCGPAGPAPDCPLDLYELLGGDVEARRPAIELQFELNPSGDDAPTLLDWKVQYTCPPAE